MSSIGIFEQRVHMNWSANIVQSTKIYSLASYFAAHACDDTMRNDLLSFSALVVGEKTLSTLSRGLDHPGGGIFFAAAHAVTGVVSGWTRTVGHAYAMPMLRLP